MVRRLNKYCFLVLALNFVIAAGFSQNEREYKDRNQFKNFRKRAPAIAAWQISALKKGALVVRLKSNQILVDALLKKGDTVLAYEKQLEMAGINKSLMKAFLFTYDFSQLYFIYASSSDSLLKGIRTNIFVDTNLRINPLITMKESYYLLAERDYAYNSSIGFVDEDLAKDLKEEGYGVKEMAIVVKNKYGHQLKKPFPYFAAHRADLKIESVYVSNINIYGIDIPFNVSSPATIKRKTSDSPQDNYPNLATFIYKGKRLVTYIPRYLTYQRLSIAIGNFNEELKQSFKKYGNRDVEKTNTDVKPFLY